MDQLLDLLAFTLGIHTENLVLYLGLLVAVSNIVGKLIPDSATGPLAIVRKIATILGLYVSNRVTSGVSAGDINRAIAASVPDSVITQAAGQLPAAIASGASTSGLAEGLNEAARVGTLVPEEFRTDPLRKGASRASSRSPWFVGLASLAIAFLLMSCTTAQKERVTATLNTLCTSAPLAQALYNTAVESNDQNRINQILAYIQATCPTTLVLIQLVPVKPVIVEPAITPERG